MSGAHSRSRTIGTERCQTDGLADELRLQTRKLHREAERSGIISALLRGRISHDGYALLLRNLHPVYERIEAGLERHRHHPAIGSLAERKLYRSSALEQDLTSLCGRRWRHEFPVLPAGQRYWRCAERATAGTGLRLIGHAYTRYLGDLNGGRVLCRRLAETLGLEASSLTFFSYPDVADLDEFATSYRRTLDDIGAMVDPIEVIAEAKSAFRHNIDLSLEVLRASDGGR